jgi:hypothetical protein
LGDFALTAAPIAAIGVSLLPLQKRLENGTPLCDIVPPAVGINNRAMVMPDAVAS